MNIDVSGKFMYKNDITIMLFSAHASKFFSYTRFNPKIRLSDL